MMKLRVYINEELDEEQALINEDDLTVLVKGDYYHDKVDARIWGFIDALRYLKIDYKLLKERYINHSDPLFGKFDFVQEDHEEYDEE